MRKQIYFMLLLLAVASGENQTAIAQCTSPPNYDNPSGLNIPRFKNASPTCLENSQITDNVDVSIGTGNIDISTASKSYMINGTSFLWNNGTSTNIYAGVNAGNNTSSSSSDNVFVGYATGNSITLGGCNTFVGSNAGKLTTSSARNVFVGCLAGFNNTNTNGGDNTFVGFKAGYSTNGGSVVGTFGNHNSFYGDESGYKNTIGNDNAGIGAYSMHESVTGNRLACLGYAAGYANTADDNTFVGYLSGGVTTTGSNNSLLPPLAFRV